MIIEPKLTNGYLYHIVTRCDYCNCVTDRQRWIQVARPSRFSLLNKVILYKMDEINDIDQYLFWVLVVAYSLHEVQE
jgi:hypothetical protein